MASNKAKNQKQTQRKQKAAARKKARSQQLRVQKNRAISSGIQGLVAGASSWPVRDSLVNEGWEESRLASCLFSRERPDGGVSAAIYLVDLGCLGVKNARFFADLDQNEYQGFLDRWQQANPNLTVVEPKLLANIVRSGVRYAANLGFRPHADFAKAMHLLKDMEVEADLPCGKDGKPFYIAGPRDNAERVIEQLYRRFGPDGFDYIAPLSESFPKELLERGTVIDQEKMEEVSIESPNGTKNLATT